MSELTDMLVDSASRLFGDLCVAAIYDSVSAGQWPAALWQAVHEAGLASALDPDADTPTLLPLELRAALARTSGGHAVPLPIAETLLAHSALVQAGLAIPAGPLSVAAALAGDRLTLQRDGDGWRLSGQLHRVPWGRDAAAIVALAEHAGQIHTVSIPRQTPARLEASYAGEPRDELRFDQLPLAAPQVGAAGQGLGRQPLLAEAALLRSAQMVGAMQTALDATLTYTGERVQFGRPIGKFQAVQQQVAVMASHVAAASAALQAAVDAAQRASDAGEAALFEIAATKLRASEAAGHAITVSHQCHGAMGFTREHALHRSTLRLMAWRDEYGSEAEWAAWIGRLVAAVGGEQLWPMVTEPEAFRAFAPQD